MLTVVAIAVLIATGIGALIGLSSSATEIGKNAKNIQPRTIGEFTLWLLLFTVSITTAIYVSLGPL